MTTDDAAPPRDAAEVRVTLPARPQYARVARLAVTGLASRNGFSYDDVEDLRIAVGELFGLLLTAVAAEPAREDLRLDLRLRLHPDALEVEAALQPSQPVPTAGELTRQILEAVSDDAEIDEAGGRVRIVKRLSPDA